MRYVEERQRRRWHRAAITRRAQVGCGLIQSQNSSPMLSHRNRHPSLSEPRKTPARDPLYFFNSLLGQQHEVLLESQYRLVQWAHLDLPVRLGAGLKSKTVEWDGHDRQTG